MAALVLEKISNETVLSSSAKYSAQVQIIEEKNIAEKTANLLLQGKTVAWFQLGSNLVPGHWEEEASWPTRGVKTFSTILMKTLNSRRVRPFAPAVLYEDKTLF